MSRGDRHRSRGGSPAVQPKLRSGERHERNGKKDDESEFAEPLAIDHW